MNLWLSIGIGAFVLVAAVFLLWPLWRRADSGGRLWMTAGVLGVLPAVAAGLYIYLGAPAILKEQALLKAHAAYDTDGMIKAMEDRLASRPEDAEGWYALGRAYIVMKRIDDAERVLAKAMQLSPKNARIIAQYAEASALKSGSLQGRPHELLMQALEIDHEDTKALELAGLAAFEDGRWAESLHYWRRLLKKLPPGNSMHDTISYSVLLAESRVREAVDLGERALLKTPEKKDRPAFPH